VTGQWDEMCVRRWFRSSGPRSTEEMGEPPDERQAGEFVCAWQVPSRILISVMAREGESMADCVGRTIAACITLKVLACRLQRVSRG